MLDLLVRCFDGSNQHFLGDFVGFAFDHHDGIGGTGDHQVQIALGEILQAWVDDDLIFEQADAHRADWSIKRNRGDHQSR